jgi:hypothetical protein
MSDTENGENGRESGLGRFLGRYVSVVSFLAFSHAYAAHEATHAVVGRAVGGEVIGWSVFPRPYVRVGYPAGKSLLRDAVGGLAPFLVGVVSLPLFMEFVWRPLIDASAWWYTHLAWYSLGWYVVYSSPLGEDYVPLREYVRSRRGAETDSGRAGA